MHSGLWNTIWSANWHQKSRSMLMIFSAGLIVLAVLLLGGLTDRQERELDALIQDTKIRCVMTDPRGTGSDNLNMISAYVDNLLGNRHDRGCYLDEYVTDVQALSIQSLIRPYGCELRQITAFGADECLSHLERAQIQLYNGWEESTFLSGDGVCLLPETLFLTCADSIQEDETGVKWISIANENSIKQVQIIGSFTGGNQSAIYVPFGFTWQEGISESTLVRACSFTIRDNTRLEEAKQQLYQYFCKPSVANGPDAAPYGVLVQDQTYLESLTRLEGSLSTLRRLIPVLGVLGCCISLIATYVTTRSRRKEFAVMRCLGMSRWQIFRIVFSEQTVLALLGGSAGIGIGWMVEGVPELGALVKAGLVIVVFLIGAAMATIRVTSVNVMKLMKVED